MSKYILTSDGELYHHGIPGMKWGVRRYQRKDGTLTAAGKKRYREATDYGKKSAEQLKANTEAYNYTRNTKEFSLAVDEISQSGWMKRNKYIDDVLNDPDNHLYKESYRKSIEMLRAKSNSGDKRTDAQIEEDWNHHFWNEMEKLVESYYYKNVAPGKTPESDYVEYRTQVDNYIDKISQKVRGDWGGYEFRANVDDLIDEYAMKQLRS